MSSCSGGSGTWIGSRTGTWTCCSGTGSGNESGSCCGTGCDVCVSGSGSNFCFAVRGRCASGAAPRRLGALRRNGSQAVFRTGPSEPVAPVRPGARRPWRPWRPLRPACRGTVRRRSRGSPSCSGLAGCRRRPRGRTSRRRGGGSPATFGTLGCPL